MKISKPVLTYSLVILISVLLLFYFFLNRRNSTIIDKNIEIKKQAEMIKVKTTDVIRALHLMDLGIRGYALLPNEANIGAYDTAMVHLEHTFSYLENALHLQKFPMDDFYTFKDSVYAYVNLGRLMFQHLQQDDREAFMDIYQHDYGYGTWLQYLKFTNQVNQFENRIFDQANDRYNSALTRNTTIFILILLLVLPTLFYTAYHSNRTYAISEQLRLSEQERNEMLSTQNIRLEKMVKERTEEIETQNEEIIAQNEELSEANLIIEQQNKTITDHNKHLQEEVDRQTQSLLKANAELVQRVEKMEQYSFIVSHNLRSPVAQILGLTTIIKHAKDKQEAEEVFTFLAKASERLDGVLKDLNQILIVENEPERRITKVNLSLCLKEVIQSINHDIQSTHTHISQAIEVEEIASVYPYIYSIFYNLLSNAIKYRNPEKEPEIRISTEKADNQVLIRISDNGLGIDMQKYGNEVFSLYRRFHTHVEGRGLGLYLTKVQVEILGGTIEMESAPGKGTTFLISLPSHNFIH